MEINAHPLSWPVGWKRTPAQQQREAKFARNDKRLTLTQGLDRVLLELQRMGVQRQDVIVSTDVLLRLDGLPRSGQPEPKDHGAAVYWQEWNGQRRVMAIDIYDKVADNLAAIAATLDAMRAIERHGGAAILERAFTGFVALPAPGPAERHWRDVLGVPDTLTPDAYDLERKLKDYYRRAASAAHPDKGGSNAAMAAVNAAYEQARRALGYA